MVQKNLSEIEDNFGQSKFIIMTPYEYLQQKGIKKLHQPWKRYNFSIEELVAFLNEYSAWRNVTLIEAYTELSKEITGQFKVGISENNQQGYIPFMD